MAVETGLGHDDSVGPLHGGDTRYALAFEGNLRMPVGKAANRREITALALALGGVLVAVALGAVFLLLSRSGDVEVRLGSSTWEVGSTTRLAANIAEDGPFLVSDVSGGHRDVFVSHVGDDPEQGWYAFAARTGGSERECALSWDRDLERFTDPCGGGTYSPEGEGLEQYPVRVDDGRVTVDINRTLEGGDGGTGGSSGAGTGGNSETGGTTRSSVVQSGTPSPSR